MNICEGKGAYAFSAVSLQTNLLSEYMVVHLQLFKVCTEIPIVLRSPGKFLMAEVTLYLEGDSI